MDANDVSTLFSTYKFSSAVSNVKFLDIAPFKKLLERSLRFNLQFSVSKIHS